MFGFFLDGSIITASNTGKSTEHEKHCCVSTLLCSTHVIQYIHMNGKIARTHMVPGEMNKYLINAAMARRGEQLID